jgi:hypothetical protein
MKLPILIINDKFLKSISIFMKTGGIALFPFIILIRLSKVPAKINHETIHIKQQQNCLCFIFLLEDKRVSTYWLCSTVQENIKNKIIYICCGRNNLFSAARIV